MSTRRAQFCKLQGHCFFVSPLQIRAREWFPSRDIAQSRPQITALQPAFLHSPARIPLECGALAPGVAAPDSAVAVATLLLRRGGARGSVAVGAGDFDAAPGCRSPSLSFSLAVLSKSPEAKPAVGRALGCFARAGGCCASCSKRCRAQVHWGIGPLPPSTVIRRVAVLEGLFDGNCCEPLRFWSCPYM